MPRICVIGTRGVPSFVGGIETICEQLYPELIKAFPSYEVTLLGRFSSSGKRKYDYKGVDVRVVSSPSISGLETFVHTFLALLYARLFVNPQIVHLHGIGPGFFSPLARLLGFKTVVTHHAADYKRPKWRWHGKLILKLGELNTILFANKVVCVSNSVMEELNSRFPFLLKKRFVIRNAGTLRNAGKSGNDNILNELQLVPKSYILAVGRLDKTKGFDDLICAYNKLSHCRRKLVIVGSSYTEDEYVQQLKKMGSNDVIFAGARTDRQLLTLYQNAALLVNPSYMEGYCLVLAEALSVGLPTIASDIAPHREFQLNELSYFPRGDIEKLSNKLGEPDFTIFKGIHAELLQAKNTWTKNMMHHEKLYSSLFK